MIVLDPRSHEAERVAALLGAELPDDLVAAAGRCDVLVVDEWTAHDAPHVAAARAGGARITCLADEVLGRSAVPVVGITGTAGKTTACHRLAAMLEAAGRPYAMARTARAANAWPDAALLEAAPALRPPAVVIAELTSTHLAWMERSPAVAVVTCLWPDHVELHGSVEAYVAAKRRIVEHQGPDDLALIGPGVPFAGPGRTVRFDGDPATATALALGIAAPAAVTATLPHRLRELGVHGGVRIVDDGMAATPAKALHGVRAVAAAGAPVHAVCGGLDPGVHRSPEERRSLAAAAAAIGKIAASVTVFGEAAPRLGAAIPGATVVADLAAAVDHALAAAAPGDVVVLAPAFPLAMADRERFSSRWTSVG